MFREFFEKLAVKVWDRFFPPTPEPTNDAPTGDPRDEDDPKGWPALLRRMGASPENMMMFGALMEGIEDYERITEKAPGGHESIGYPGGLRSITPDNFGTAPWPHVVVSMTSLPHDGNPTCLVKKGWFLATHETESVPCFRVAVDTPIVLGGTTFLDVEPIEGVEESNLPTRLQLVVLDSDGEMLPHLRAGVGSTTDVSWVTNKQGPARVREAVVHLIRTALCSGQVPGYIAEILSEMVSSSPECAKHFHGINYEIERRKMSATFEEVTHTTDAVLTLNFAHDRFRGTVKLGFIGPVFVSAIVEGAHAEFSSPVRQDFRFAVNIIPMGGQRSQYRHPEPKRWEHQEDDGVLLRPETKVSIAEAEAKVENVLRDAAGVSTVHADDDDEPSLGDVVEIKDEES